MSHILLRHSSSLFSLLVWGIVWNSIEGRRRRSSLLLLHSENRRRWLGDGGGRCRQRGDSGTCRPRKVPAALWWHSCEAVCSLAGTSYPGHIIKHLHSHKNPLLAILLKTYKMSDSLTFASSLEGVPKKEDGNRRDSSCRGEEKSPEPFCIEVLHWQRELNQRRNASW